MNPSKKISLRLLLILPFILQIFGAVGLVGYLSFQNGQKAVEELANQLMLEVGERISERLNLYLETPHLVNQLNKDAIDLGQLDLEDLPSMEPHFWRQSQLFNLISYIQFGSNSGEFVGLAVNDDGTFAYQVTDFTGVLQTYAIDEQGKRGKFLQTSPNFDPRRRPWYIVPKQADKPAWTPIYAWVNPPTLAITLGQPYYDKKGKFQGILATDLTIAQISDFLRSLKIGKSGKTFILERSGLLIATSSTESPFMIKNNTPQRLAASESRDMITRSTFKYLTDYFDNLTSINSRQQLSFTISGQRQFVQVMSINDRRGVDWLSVVVVPESDFMEQINANTRTTILLCLAALGIATILGIFTAHWITKPILRLSQASEAVATGNLEQNVGQYRVNEIDILAQSFNRMAQQLRESFTKLAKTTEELEIRVKERTTQLAAANAEIIQLNEKLQTENLRLGAEVDVARQIQQMVLPKPEELASIEGLDIAGFMEPAAEMGGDYYDVLETDGIVTVGIGDVTGHGLESGLLMLMTQTAVCTLQEIREQDPVRFLDTLNRTIYRNVQRMNSDKNLTLAILNYSEGRVSITGQHEETLLVRAGGHIERIDTMDLGLPIGLDDDIADFIDHTIVELHPGDGVVVYTDGIPEAFNLKKKQYGMERLCEIISQNWQHNAQEIKQAVIDNLRAFIGGQKIFDDITLVILKQQ